MKIDKGVPIPTRHTPSYISHLMTQGEVGDSILVPNVTAQAVWEAAKRLQYQGCYRSRKEGSGIRVWKVKEPNHGPE